MDESYLFAVNSNHRPSDHAFSDPKIVGIWLVLCIGSNLGLKFGRERPTGSDRFLPVNAVMKG